MQTGTKRIKTNQNGTKANAVTVVHEFSHIFSYIRKPGDPGEQEKCHPRSESDAAGCCRMLPGLVTVSRFVRRDGAALISIWDVAELVELVEAPMVG
jgi:hypothetical protein